MLILFLNVVHYDIKPSQADHVQPKTPLFTSGSQHPPRFGHAVYLGGIVVPFHVPFQANHASKNAQA